MAKPTSLRTCKSIGSRTRSKRPDVPNVELPSVRSKSKKRVQSKLKVKKSNATESHIDLKRTTSDAADNTTDKDSKRRRIIKSPEGLTNDVDSIERTVSKRIGGRMPTRSARCNAQTTASTSGKTTVQPTSIAMTEAVELPTKSKVSTSNSSNLTDTTPKQSLIHKPITPSPTLQLNNAPSLHTPWQSLSYKNTSVPWGVVNISLQPHSCCLHSLISHRGYSWLTSKQRCGCMLDSDHNSSECLTEVYYGSYVNYEKNENREWETERWLLDSIKPTGFKKNVRTSDTGIEKHLNYISRQPHLTSNMRAILIDWLVEMSLEYRLHAETVYLAVSLTDRALACVGYESKRKGAVDMVVSKDKLQCVGCACTLIASKLLEITPPTVQDFCYISDNSYTRKEITEMEAKICSALKFNFNYDTPYKYIDKFLRASFATKDGKTANVSIRKMMEHMVLYLVDLSLLEYKFVKVKPSLVTAAAVYLARATLGIREVPVINNLDPLKDPNMTVTDDLKWKRVPMGFWTRTLEHHTGYDEWDLEKSVKMLRRLHENAESNHLKSIYSKFKSDQFGKIAFKTVLNESDLNLDILYCCK